ncbi:hypothetical protein MLD38_008693 [Melastoma candidum]|uniref:Uncharacterized protein n=1 Tax=Melastoma candidum TaxID=119954 RepID=A0ACB9RVQ0_9MYRT|nr:hypothetical protein MLD38_008693 [Melastoma candidum]
MGFGLHKDERLRRVSRGAKTMFFLFSMLISLLLLSAPILVVIADTLIPSALLSASLSPSSLPLSETISSHFAKYDFRYSLIDVPLVSILRSAIIICVYGLCDGPRRSRWPYLGTTTMCSAASLAFVSLKAVYVFGGDATREGSEGARGRALEMGMVVCSAVVAVAHVAVAYRISCRERRKLLVYKIDIEAVSALEEDKFLTQPRFLAPFETTPSRSSNRIRRRVPRMLLSSVDLCRVREMERGSE